MNDLAKLVLAHGENNDATKYPFWAIVKRGGFGRVVWLDGFWFSREEATEFLESRRYNYGKSAFVYCFSGHNSWHCRALFGMARGEYPC